MDPSPADAIITPTHPTLPNFTRTALDRTRPELRIRFDTLPDPNELLCRIFYTQQLLHDPY